MTAAAPTWLQRLARFGEIIEDSLLVMILTSMIVLACWQIFARNFLDIGFIWADELLRILVLWVALIGAVAASRRDKHIVIDILARPLSGRARALAGAVTSLFTTSVCAVAAWYALQFVLEEKQYGGVVLGGLPSWYFLAVLPAGFGLIAYRYLLFSLRDVLGIFRPPAQATAP